LLRCVINLIERDQLNYENKDLLISKEEKVILNKIFRESVHAHHFNYQEVINRDLTNLSKKETQEIISHFTLDPNHPENPFFTSKLFL